MLKIFKGEEIVAFLVLRDNVSEEWGRRGDCLAGRQGLQGGDCGESRDRCCG